jgi:hypothetical protein
LFAVSRGEKILIGSTKGLSDGFLKIDLKPGWRFTKRTYGDKVLGHFYLSNDNYIARDVIDEIDEVAVDIEVPEVEEEEIDEVAVDIEVPEVVEETDEVAVDIEVPEVEEETDEVAVDIEVPEVEEETDEVAVNIEVPEVEEEEEKEEEEAAELNSNTWKQFLEMLRQSMK